MRTRSDINAFDAKGETALCRVAKHGYSTTVDDLLKQGADVNIANKRGRTPLHIAAAHGHINLVAVLLKNRVPIQMRILPMVKPLCIPLP